MNRKGPNHHRMLAPHKGHYSSSDVPSSSRSVRKGLSPIMCVQEGTSLAVLLIPFMCLAVITFSPIASLSFQPATLKIGQVEIHPSVGFEATYNDNVGLTQPKTPDTVLVISPGLRIACGRIQTPVQRPRLFNPTELTTEFLYDLYVARLAYMGQRGYRGVPGVETRVGKPLDSHLQNRLRFRSYSLGISYTPSVYNFMEHTGYNFLHHEASFSADYRAPAGLYLRAYDELLSSTTLTTYDRYQVIDLARQQLKQGVGFTTNLSSFTLGYNFFTSYLLYLVYSYYTYSIDGFSLDQFFSRVPFPLTNLIDVSLEGLTSHALTMNLHTTGLFMSKGIGTMTAVSIGYLFGRLTGNMDECAIAGRVHIPQVPDMEAQAVIGLAHDPRNATFHEIRFGLQRVITARRFVFGWPVPKTFVEGTVSYQIRTFDSNQWMIRTTHGPYTTVDFSLPSFKEVGADLKVQTALSPKTNVTVRLLRQPKEDVGGLGNVTINWEGGVSVIHQFNNKCSINTTGSYRYMEHTWPDAVESKAQAVYATCVGTYQLQTWLSAHLGYEFVARLSDMTYNRYTSNRVWLRTNMQF